MTQRPGPFVNKLGRLTELERADQGEVEDPPPEGDPAGDRQQREGEGPVERDRPVAGRVRESDERDGGDPDQEHDDPAAREPVAGRHRDAGRPADLPPRQHAAEHDDGSRDGGHRPTPAERPATHRHDPSTPEYTSRLRTPT